MKKLLNPRFVVLSINILLLSILLFVFWFNQEDFTVIRYAVISSSTSTFKQQPLDNSFYIIISIIFFSFLLFVHLFLRNIRFKEIADYVLGYLFTAIIGTITFVIMYNFINYLGAEQIIKARLSITGKDEHTNRTAGSRGSGGTSYSYYLHCKTNNQNIIKVRITNFNAGVIYKDLQLNDSLLVIEKKGLFYDKQLLIKRDNYKR